MLRIAHESVDVSVAVSEREIELEEIHADVKPFFEAVCWRKFMLLWNHSLSLHGRILLAGVLHHNRMLLLMEDIVSL